MNHLCRRLRYLLLATVEQAIYHMRLALDNAALKRRITNSLMKGRDCSLSQGAKKQNDEKKSETLQPSGLTIVAHPPNKRNKICLGNSAQFCWKRRQSLSAEGHPPITDGNAA